MKKQFLILIALIAVFSVACATQQSARERKETLLSKGMTLVQYGDYDEAQVKFEEILKEDANNPHALNFMGNIYEKREQFQDALDFYQRAAEAHVPMVEQVFEEPRYDGLTIKQLAEKNIERLRSAMLSKVMAELESTRKELQAMEKAIKEGSPSNGAEKAEKAEKGQNAQNTAAPVMTIEKIGNIKAAYEKAFHDFNNRQYNQSLAEFRKIIEISPDNRLADNAQYWIGEVYYTTHDYPKALEMFQKVIKDYPDGNKVPDAMLKIGYTYLALKDKKNAVATLNKLIKAYPTSESAKNARVRLSRL